MKKISATKILSFFSIAFLLLTILQAYASVPGEPHPGNAVWVEPSTITLTDYAVGDKFNVTIWLNMTTLKEGGQGIVAWQTVLYYNTTYINATRAGYTSGSTSQLFAGHQVFPAPIRIEADYVGCGETLLGVTDYVPVPVCASLAWMEFEVIALTPQPINFKLNINNEDTKIIDLASNQYPPSSITIYDALVKSPVTYTLTISSTTGGTTNPAPGTYTYPEETRVNVTAIPTTGYILDHWELNGANIGNPNPIQVTMDADHTLQAVFTSLGTILYVDPPEIINPTIEPGSPFEINVTIDDVANMLTCEFNLTYDTNIITCIIVEVLKVQNQTPTPNIMFNDEIGYVWVKLKYKSSITTTTTTPLVKITFNVDARGVTTLDLTNTTLTDSTGQQISHTAIDGFFAALIQDLSITNVVVSSNWVYKSQPVNINVTVKNLGNQKESFDVKTYYDAALIGTQHFTDLDPNAETTLTFTWDTSTAEPCGNYTIKAEVTILPYETNTADNTYTDGNVKVYARDIAITNVVASRVWVYQGWTVEINVTAKNLGDLEESFDINLYYNNTELIETQHVMDLPPNTEITLTFTWNTSLVQPCHNYAIMGEAALLYDHNVTNNVYQDGNVKVRIIGDVNGDNKVDIVDLNSIGKAFLSRSDSPRWNPDADINQDGYIDIKDLRLASKNFMKNCT
jgi:hypothetical protein